MSTLNVNNINEAGGVSPVITAGDIEADAITAVNASALPAGSILQVVSTTKTDTFSASLAGQAFSSNVTGLTASITPISTSSKILVQVSIHGSQSSNEARLAYRLDRDGTSIGIGDAASSRPRLTSKSWGLGNSAAMMNTSISFLDSPASTSTLTYGVQIHNHSSGPYTFYVNRSSGDSDNSEGARTISTITLTEVAA